jgi:hypothetical protein
VQLALEDVRVEGRRSPLLEAVSLRLATGECVLLAGDPGQGHTALALVATGRIAPFQGTVTLLDDDGGTVPSTATLRAVTAVVDLPGVTEPDDVLTVGTVVAESLALARRSARPGAASRWLAERGLADREGERMDDRFGPVRTALLAALATEREGVRFLVLTLPDRHGGEPAGWWDVARTLASGGYGVLVQCTRSSARDLGAVLLPAEGATARRATPLEALREGPVPAANDPGTGR